MPIYYSNIGLVQSRINSDVLEASLLPSDAKVVYSNDLSLREGKFRYRATKNLLDIMEGRDPVVLVNRSPIERMVEISGEVPRQYAYTKDVINNTFADFTVSYGRLLMNFLFITRNIKVLDDFEVSYATGGKVASHKLLSIDFGSPIGIHDYIIKWENPQELVLLADDFALKTLSFSAYVVGWFFYGRLTGGLIKQIDIFYRDMYSGQLLESDSVGDAGV